MVRRVAEEDGLVAWVDCLARAVGGDAVHLPPVPVM